MAIGPPPDDRTDLIAPTDIDRVQALLVIERSLETIQTINPTLQPQPQPEEEPDKDQLC